MIMHQTGWKQLNPTGHRHSKTFSGRDTMWRLPLPALTTLDDVSVVLTPDQSALIHWARLQSGPVFSSRICRLDMYTSDRFELQSRRSVLVDWTWQGKSRAKLPVSEGQVLVRSPRKACRVVPTVSTLSNCCCCYSAWQWRELIKTYCIGIFMKCKVVGKNQHSISVL